MKVGDTLYCKKDYFFEYKKLNTKNVNYKIVNIIERFDIKYRQYIVSCNDKSGNTCIFFKGELEHYFMTEKENRKCKLKKINESRK